MDLRNRTILITGSTDGVGREVAVRLGAAGARVLVHGRDRARGEAVASAIERAGGSARLHLADLASLAEVRALSDAVLREEPALHVLINNAGVGTGGARGTRALSRDGYELRFAVNYLAGYVLTRALLPLLERSAPARIVNVSSAGQQAIDFDDPMLERGYSGSRAYCQSKLAQILFTMDLAEALAGRGVTATCLHPATYMDTTMVRQSGVAPMSTVAQGAEAIVQLAVSPAVAGRSGEYFNGLRPARPDAQASDREARARLRQLSDDLVARAIG